MRYIMKYLEKSGEKIVYSRGLPQYFISDIWEEDIACPYNEEETKFLLFDNFGCWDEGVYIGQVSPEVIEQMNQINFDYDTLIFINNMSVRSVSAASEGKVADAVRAAERYTGGGGGFSSGGGGGFSGGFSGGGGGSAGGR